MLRSWAAHTYPKFMTVLRWGIDLAQLYTNGGTGMCIGLQSSLEGNGVATSNSGPFEKFGGCRGGGGAFWTIPKTLVIWASSSHITLAIWVTVRIRVRVTRDAHITRIWVIGMPISL